MGIASERRRHDSFHVKRSRVRVRRDSTRERSALLSTATQRRAFRRVSTTPDGDIVSSPSPPEFARVTPLPRIASGQVNLWHAGAAGLGA